MQEHAALHITWAMSEPFVPFAGLAEMGLIQSMRCTVGAVKGAMCIPHLYRSYIEFNTSYRLDIADTKNMPNSEVKVRGAGKCQVGSKTQPRNSCTEGHGGGCLST